MVRIAADGPRDVVFAVPEDKMAAVRSGTPVQVRPWASESLLNGSVREVAASADPATRTYAVKVSLDAKAPPPLGATVTVIRNCTRGAPAMIKIPISALRQEGAGTAVWVLGGRP